jgi:hypothetical protein
MNRTCFLVAVALFCGERVPAAEFALKPLPSSAAGQELRATVTLTRLGATGGESQHVAVTVGKAVSVPLHSGIWRVHTVAAGYFSIDSVLEIERDDQEVTIPVWQTARLRGSLVVAKNATLPATLAARWSASEPGAGVEVPPDGASACTVQKDVFSCEVPMGVMNLRLRAPTYITHFRWNVKVTAAGVDMGTLALIHGASIVGHVAASRAILSSTGVTRVFIRPFTYDGTQKREALLTATARPDNGFFEFNGVAEGDYLVAAMQGKLRSPEVPVRVSGTGESEMTSALVLKPPRRLRVTIDPATDPEGKTWKVSLSTYRTEHALDSPRQAFATIDGVSVWDELLPTRYRLSIGSHLRGTVLSKEIDLQDEAADISVSIPLTSVKGTVRLGAKPIAGVLTIGGRNVPVSVPLDVADDGSFSGRVPFDPKSEWSVSFDSISPPIQSTLSVRPRELAESEGGGWRLDVELEAWGIDGIVVDADGKPITKAIIDIASVDGQQPVMQVHPADDGSFSIGGLASGTYRVAAKSFRHESSDTVAVHIGKDDTAAQVKLVVTPDDEIEGRVVAMTGPIGGAQVGAYATDKSWILSIPSMTAPDGSFLVAIPPGAREVDFVVAPPGFPLKMLHMTVRHEPLTVTLEANAGSLELDVPELRDTIDEPQGVLVHRGAVKSLIAFLGFREMAIRPGSVAGTSHLSVPMMEPGDYALCAVPLRNVNALRIALPPKDCVFGTLAPFGSLHLAMTPRGQSTNAGAQSP